MSATTRTRSVSAVALVAAAALFAAILVGTRAGARADATLALTPIVVTVDADGNAAAASQFATPPGTGSSRRFFLVLQNGRGSAPTSPPPVDALSVTLNGAVVFQTIGAVEETHRVEVALLPVGGAQNSVVIQCAGQTGSAVAALIAESVPPENSVGGTLFLATARIGPKLTTVLTVAAAGDGAAGFRVRLYQRDGTLAATSGVNHVPPHGVAAVDLAALVRAIGVPWASGPVEVVWATSGSTQVIGTAQEAVQSQVRGAVVRAARPALTPMHMTELGVHPITSEVAQGLLGP